TRPVDNGPAYQDKSSCATPQHIQVFRFVSPGEAGEHVSSLPKWAARFVSLLTLWLPEYPSYRCKSVHARPLSTPGEAPALGQPSSPWIAASPSRTEEQRDVFIVVAQTAEH